MTKERIEVTIRFTVDEEWVSGMFYNPQDFADTIAKDVLYSLVAYKPKILEKSFKKLTKMPEWVNPRPKTEDN